MSEAALRRLAAWGERFRGGRSVSVGPSEWRLDEETANQQLLALGQDGEISRCLESAATAISRTIVSLSPLTEGLALDYIDRLARPIPSLSPQTGVETVTNSYAAHLAVEHHPADFGADDVPVLGTLPPPRHGRPPQDLLTRVVKASRRSFPLIRAISAPVWDGYVVLLTQRIHRGAVNNENLIAVEVVDGLARFGWVLRQVDIHYKLDPERSG
jgi:hypothetical protein